MTIPSFICTRATVAAVEDKEKLYHLLGYLKGTSGKKLHFQPQGVLQIEAYINAAFALHPDSKFHNGIVIFIGKSLVFAALRKQRI
jgi:hypothetical protein